MVPAAADERDFPADVLAQQLFRFEQVVLVVLLDDADSRRLGERPEVDGGGIDRRSDVDEVQVRFAAGDLDVAHVTDEREARVVDRQRQLRLIVERGRAGEVLRRLCRFGLGRGRRRFGGPH